MFLDLADRLLQAHFSRARYFRRLNAGFIKLAEGSFQPVDQNQKTLGFRLILIRQMYTVLPKFWESDEEFEVETGE